MDKGGDPNTNIMRFKHDYNLQDLMDPNIGEAEFEVSFEDMKNDEQNHSHFDGEQIYQNINIECCIDGDNGSPFDEKMKNMTDVLEGGVYKTIKKIGSGEIVPENAVVKVHYNAYTEFSDEPFDSTRLRNDPFQFRLNSGDVVLGLNCAVSTMRKGEISEFLILPSYFMGKMGIPPRIPPEATVLFQIELLTYFANDELHPRTEKEQEENSFNQLLLNLKSQREQGNELFKQLMYNKALIKYTKSYHILDTYNIANQFQEKQKNDEILKIILNISQCHLKLFQPRQAYSFALKALNLDEKNAKALFRCGKALLDLSEFKKARDYLLQAQKVEPNNVQITETIAKLEKLSTNFTSTEKRKYLNLFKTGQ